VIKGKYFKQILTGVCCFLLCEAGFAKQKQKKESVSMKEYANIQSFLKENPEKLNKILKIQVDGKNLRTHFSKTECVYYETALLFFMGETVAGYTNVSSSSDPFYIIVDSQFKIKVQRGMRLYLSPVVYKEYTQGNAYGEEHKRLLSEEGYDKLADAEYMLVKGKTYFAVMREETYYLPPEKAEGDPEKAFHKVLYISDEEFYRSEPEKEKTPSSDWTY